ncbi:MAG TPA: M28 family peptidase [Solirubrobacterales bacterium]|jgi:acetylornithine deacetylase/succinyl-diaminopimelate desuccinylase-like protein|nr:M28 family peptidase [Solirubrobacterales bacterium]
MASETNWLRERLEELERIDRPSASEGERRAAEWLVARFAEEGAEARIEAEPAHGTYWWPLGIGAALGALGALAALRGRRLLGTLLGAVGAAGIADDFPPGQRRLRRVLPRRTTYNVVCELGDPEAERTVVVIAHHDSAHSGLVFHPAVPPLADRLGLIEKTDTSPPLMAPVIGGPILAALGALTGRRLLAKLGLLLGIGSVAAMADIGARKVVPGANDNGTSVVTLLALARRFAAEPPAGTRVILLSTGSEESFSEGMKAFGERHFPRLPRESTFFLCLESIGSPHLLVLRGEGFLKMREYPPRSLAFMDGLAEELGIWLFPNLRLHNGTDGLESAAAGYETAVLAGCTDLKQPANYHWSHDLAENVDFDTVADGIRLSEAAIRRLGERWL